MYRLSLLVLLCWALPSYNCANSQEQDQYPPQQVVGASSDTVESERTTAITRAVSAATPAVVSVNVIAIQRVRADPFFDDLLQQFLGQSMVRDRQLGGSGSGFVISADGYIVTNDHVVQYARQLDRSRITVSFPDGATMEARLVGSDPFSDIALLKTEPDKPLPYLAFTQSRTPVAGEWAIALGNPFGLFEATEPTVTVGVVSAVDRDFEYRDGHIYRDMIQTDAAINEGNSGGPLLNASAEVIGVNTFIVTPSGANVGIGFAVPASKASRIVQEIQDNGAVDRSYYTGLSGMDMNERIGSYLGIPSSTGVFVKSVARGSPAAQAGFRPYDVIVSLEEEPIANQAQYISRLYDFRPGDTVDFGVIRGESEAVIPMQLGSNDRF